MTQIVDRRLVGIKALSTLADGASFLIDGLYASLPHKAFLFEYEAQGDISSAVTTEFYDDEGLSIVLVAAGTSNTDIANIIGGTAFTDQNQNVQIPFAQQMFALGTIMFHAFNDDAVGEGNFHWKIHFKPKAKGGIPFTEGSGWELKIINRSGAALSVGNLLRTTRIYSRFAFEGGGGA